METFNQISAAARELRSKSLLVIGFAFAATILLHRDSVLAMAGIWLRSDTFAHGLIVVPLALYLVFQQRHVLGEMQPRPYWPGFVLLPLVSLAWATGRYLDVDALEQFATVAFVPGTILALAGKAVAARIGFALMFLFFAVPFGEFLIPYLMEVTADITTALLNLTGFPVFRSGMIIAVPGGDFEIAKACSGIRYLIASVVLGTIFAYLTFNTWRKRLIFIGVSAVIPVLANGVRAYFIVVLASLSGHQLAVGVDHFVYGWVFFGIVMFVLFIIGVRYRDEPARPDTAIAADQAAGPSGFALTLGALASLAIIQAGPLLLALSEARADPVAVARLPAVAPGWTRVDRQPPWRPDFRPGAQRLYRAVSDGTLTVFEFVELYRRTEGGIDAGGGNRLVNSADRQGASVPVAGGSMRAVPVHAGDSTFQVLTWYQAGSRRSGSAARAKLYEAWDSLVHGGASSAVVALAVRGDATDRQHLLQYVEQNYSELAGCLLASQPQGDCE